MAFKNTMINGHPTQSNLREYICQSVDDIAKLPRCGIPGTQESTNDGYSNEPCAIGSTAVVVNGSRVFVLAPNNEWAEV